MYHNLNQRRRDVFAQCAEILNQHCRDMALDSRSYHRFGYPSGPGSLSSASTSGLSGLTGITTPTAGTALTSSASSPSLRSRESVSVPVGYRDGVASPSPGGNVRVVVRVRKFLPRGMALGLY